jgi:hypothetical protein
MIIASQTRINDARMHFYSAYMAWRQIGKTTSSVQVLFVAFCSCNAWIDEKCLLTASMDQARPGIVRTRTAIVGCDTVGP